MTEVHFGTSFETVVEVAGDFSSPVVRTFCKACNNWIGEASVQIGRLGYDVSNHLTEVHKPRGPQIKTEALG